MQETLRHRDAFEFYYSLGDSRSLPQVAQRFTVSERSVKKWSRVFGWQDRVAERDAKNAEKLAKKTDTTIVAQKAKYLQVVRAAIVGLVEAHTDRATGKLVFPCGKGGPAADYERLVKLDLLLSGEATERTDDMGTVILKVDDGVDPDSPEALAEEGALPHSQD